VREVNLRTCMRSAKYRRTTVVLALAVVAREPGTEVLPAKRGSPMRQVENQALTEQNPFGVTARAQSRRDFALSAGRVPAGDQCRALARGTSPPQPVRPRLHNANPGIIR